MIASKLENCQRCAHFIETKSKTGEWYCKLITVEFFEQTKKIKFTDEILKNIESIICDEFQPP